MKERLPRKLAAILYADVAGYSRLTGEDEDATHRTLGEYLDLIASTIESHHGQVMHYAGDAVLAQFTAVLDALSSAVAIQNELQTRNEALQWVEKAIRRDPYHVDWYCIIQGEALYCLRDYAGAVRAIRQARLSDNYWGNALLAASCAQIDRMEEARTAAQRVVDFRDEAQVSGRPLPFSDLEFDFADSADLDHFRDGLRKAGLME